MWIDFWTRVWKREDARGQWLNQHCWTDHKYSFSCLHDIGLSSVFVLHRRLGSRLPFPQRFSRCHPHCLHLSGGLMLLRRPPTLCWSRSLQGLRVFRRNIRSQEMVFLWSTESALVCLDSFASDVPVLFLPPLPNTATQTSPLFRTTVGGMVGTPRRRTVVVNIMNDPTPVDMTKRGVWAMCDSVRGCLTRCPRLVGRGDDEWMCKLNSWICKKTVSFPMNL